MAEPAGLRVPSRHVGPLTEFAALDDDAAQRVLSVLQEDPPIVDADIVERRLAEDAPALSRPDEFLGALISIDLLRSSHEWSSEQVAAGVSASNDLDLDSEARERLRERLIAALGLPSLSATAKALDLASAHERLLHISRVVTDLRPVFAQEVESRPVGAVLTHSLELTFFGNRGQLETLFMGMDDAALARLANAVKRAEAKSLGLRKFATETGLEIVDVDLEEL